MGRRIQNIVFGKAGLRKRQQKLLRKRLKNRLKGFPVESKHEAHKLEQRAVEVKALAVPGKISKAERRYRALLRTIARDKMFELFRSRRAA